MLTTASLLSLLAAVPVPEAATPGPGPNVMIAVDSARREVTLRVGPFTIAAMPEGMNHGDHGAHDMGGMETPFLAFDWPVTGWLRGFRITLADADGRPLPRRLIHHVNMMNFERRALLYDAVERTLAAGQETEDLTLPRAVGFPMTAGTPVGLMAAWANDTDADIEAVYLTVTLLWSPTNLSPRPLDALPLYMDVSYQGPGQSDSYDLPAGASSKSHEFTLPVGGRLLGVGGHLHDYARELILEDLETGRTVVRLRAKLDREGKLLSVERRLYGARGDGLALRGGRRYRITARYDNPTGAAIPSGAMGIMIGLFVPEDLAKWPTVDRSNPGIQADIAAIRSTSPQAGSHSHHEQPKP
ncbi:MAG: hypothetical protein ABR551_00765 [Gemmatimonadales bacterium]